MSATVSTVIIDDKGLIVYKTDNEIKIAVNKTVVDAKGNKFQAIVTI